MGNSTIKLQAAVDDSRRFAELQPIFASGGNATQPALQIANEIFGYLFAPDMPWKFNSFQLPYFYTNSWQQDYAIPGLTTLARLEQGVIVDINNTSIPKPIIPIEVVRAQQLSFNQYGQPALANWYYNSQLVYGTWGGSTSDLGNDPQAGSVYSPFLGVPSQPANPIMQIKDANGNLLVLTTIGTTGSVAPVLPANSVAGTTVSDGSCVWTVVDPNGQGIRLSPMPSQTGTVFQVRLTGQAKPPVFTSLQQTLSPLPDDLSRMFFDGFRAYAYRYSPEAKIRAKFAEEYQLWVKSVASVQSSQTHEKEEYGFYPSQGIMAGTGAFDPGPAWPFGGGFGNY